MKKHKKSRKDEDDYDDEDDYSDEEDESYDNMRKSGTKRLKKTKSNYLLAKFI
jgi:hypothetical protein